MTDPIDRWPSADWPGFLGHGLFDAFGPLPERLHDGGVLDFGLARESTPNLNSTFMFPEAWEAVVLGRCPLDTDGDGDCAACARARSGCLIHAAQHRTLDWSVDLEEEI